MATVRSKPRSDWTILIVTLVSISIHHALCATQAEERSSEKVQIKMYDLSTSDWSTSKRSTFSTVIASEATTYCAASLSSCGLDGAITFTASEVGTSSAEKDGASIVFTFYIDYPSGASVSAGGDTAHVVPQAAAQAIATAARDEVKDQVGYYITYVDDEYLSIPPNTDTNRVIVPIAFVVVFLLVIAVISMHYYQKHRDRKQLIAKRLLKKQQQQQMGTGGGASYSALDTTTTTILTANNSTTPRRGYNNNINNNNNTIHNNSGGLSNSHTKFSTRDQFPRDDPMDHDETGPVVVSLASGKAQYQTPSEARRSRPSSSVNEFHDGHVVIGDDVNAVAKLAPKKSVAKQQAMEQFSVAETLEEDEARRERKRRRREKRKEKERKRREEEEGGIRVMENSYENPTFNTSNMSEGSYSFQ